MKRLGVIAIILLIIAVLGCVGTYVSNAELRLLDEKGVRTEAVVTEKTLHRPKRGGNYYQLTFRYQVQNGSTRTATERVSKDFAERADVSGKIPIKYLPSQPNQLFIIGESGPSGAGYFMSAILAFVGAIMGIAYLNNRAAQRKGLPAA